MSKLFSRNALAVLALAFPVVALADTTLTLSSGQTLNLDTGKTVTSGGDISWDGSNVAVVGSATDADLAMFGFSGSSSYQTLSSSIESALGSDLSTSSFSPAVNDVIAVHTNGGNYSKILVTAITGTSITLEFDTFGGSSTSGGPTITGVVNNYSFIPAGFPNSGVAPGTLFVISGSGLASAPTGNLTLNSSAGQGIPLTSAGASVSVQAGGKTFTPGLYYASPAQIAAVLPSGTPTGSATVTVTYNNATSNAFSFQVVPYALGFGTYSEGVIATTTGYALHGYTNSAKPGETIILWGSGLGADTADSDTVYTGTPHSVNTPLQIYFGGVPGHIVYAGSSGFPGLNQIDVTIPENATTGCYVTVVGVTGTGSSITTSNFGHLAISPSGGECNDSIFGLSGGTISTLSGQSTVRAGDLFVGQLISPKSQTDNTPQTTNIAFAEFSKDTGSTYSTSTGSSSSAFSLGSCFVSEIVSSSGGGTGTSVGLDAGNISLTGPAGTYQLTTIASIKGSYIGELPSNAITSSGGAFKFNGSGGADVGSFSTTVNLPNPILTWTNQSAGATVNRAQGVDVTWTGGGAGTYVIISGSSSDSNTGASGSFTCITNQSAGSFQVPGYVTSTLPAGSGSLDVENATSFGIFKATGIDFGFQFGFTGVSINSTYQ